MTTLTSTEAATLALLRWASLVQVGQHSLADWLTVVESEPGRLILPIRTDLYGCGVWEIRPGHALPDRVSFARFAMMRAAGTYAIACNRWDDAARSMLRYLQRGPFTVIARSEP